MSSELSTMKFGSSVIHLRDDQARTDIADLEDQIQNGSLVTIDHKSTASFYDVIGAQPLNELTVDMGIRESGSSDPSPANVHTFTPYSNCVIYHSGSDMSSPQSSTVSFPNEAGAVYCGSVNVATGKLKKTWGAVLVSGESDIHGINTDRKLVTISLPGSGSASWSTEAEMKKLKCSHFKTLSTSATWNNYDLFASKFNGGESVALKYAEEFTSLSAAGAWFQAHPTLILYEMEEAEEYDVTPAELLTYTGQNVFWSNGTEISRLRYRLPPSTGGSDSGGGSRNYFRFLMFGNSFTYSTLEYLPLLLQELLPDTEIVFAICYSPGCAFAKHITKFNGGNGDDIAAEYDNYSEYNSTAGEWETITDKYTAQMALDKYEWDVIGLQQSVENLAYFDDMGTFAGLVQNYITYPALFVYNMAQARHAGDTTWVVNLEGETMKDKSNTHFGMIADYAEDAEATPYVDGVLPCATAVQNLRTLSAMDAIGDSGYLAKDGGGHLQHGLGMLAAGYAAAYKLMRLIGETPKLYGMRFTPAYEDLSAISSPTLGNSAVVGITAENKMRAMKAAMMAVKNPYTVTDMADYEA
ncbi:MAG: DUF4886 domain-containing protein [Clostridia bacterium]|nr:DUF4886 domain-containing protein [Clostridia bacterium]